MEGNDVFATILILIIIALAAYFLYKYLRNDLPINHENQNTKETFNKTGIDKDKPKHVRFNRKVDYKYISPTRSDIKNAVHNKLVQEHFTRDRDYYPDPQCPDGNCPSPIDATPTCYDLPTSESWDSSFGLPLMEPEEKRVFFAKMQQNWTKYNDSIRDFDKFQNNRDNVEEPKTTIDPFVTDHRSKQLIGKSIKEIYDEQVAGPTAKPMKVLNKTKTNVYYEDEPEMNGGTIRGTSLIGYDGLNGGYESSSFGNGF